MEESSQPREHRGTKRSQSFVFAWVTTSICRRFWMGWQISASSSRNLPKEMLCSRSSRLSLPLDTPSFRVLCPTRWTVRATSLQSVLDNFEVLLCVWEEAQCAQLDSEMRARIVGVNAQMQTFDFLFWCFSGKSSSVPHRQPKQEASTEINISCRRPEASYADT